MSTSVGVEVALHQKPLQIFVRVNFSQAWGPPQFQENRSRSEKAIPGALGEFLGAALGIRNSIPGIRNSILGMASHDLSNTKTTIRGATPGAIPGIDGNPYERFSYAPAFSEGFFKNWGGPRAREFHLLVTSVPSFWTVWRCTFRAPPSLLRG